jgi:hypothetical protein
MKWHYHCPICGLPHSCKWEERKEKQKCIVNFTEYHPPTPAKDHQAFVNTRQWSEEIEKAVVKIRGNKCTVPGCKKEYETLDHRIPWSKKRKTSVENLWPMCEEHNKSKGNSAYEEWVAVEAPEAGGQKPEAGSRKPEARRQLAVGNNPIQFPNPGLRISR